MSFWIIQFLTHSTVFCLGWIGCACVIAGQKSDEATLRALMLEQYGTDGEKGK